VHRYQRDIVDGFANNKALQAEARLIRRQYMTNARKAAGHDRAFWIKWARHTNRTLLSFKDSGRKWEALLQSEFSGPQSAPASPKACEAPEGRPPQKAVSEASLEALSVGSIFLHKERQNLMGLPLRCHVTQVDGEWVRYSAMDVPADGQWHGYFTPRDAVWSVKEVVRG
jgi:hypothetical protein